MSLWMEQTDRYRRFVIVLQASGKVPDKEGLLKTSLWGHNREGGNEGVRKKKREWKGEGKGEGEERRGEEGGTRRAIWYALSFLLQKTEKGSTEGTTKNKERFQQINIISIKRPFLLFEWDMSLWKGTELYMRSHSQDWTGKKDTHIHITHTNRI